jgi:hypothetical protein
MAGPGVTSCAGGSGITAADFLPRGNAFENTAEEEKCYYVCGVLTFRHHDHDGLHVLCIYLRLEISASTFP